MNKDIFFQIIFRMLAMAIAVCIYGCTAGGETEGKLDIAEQIMEQRPDSALSILNSIDGFRISGSRVKARHALLKSIALDKNYIDTTTFDVLQPAIDYYLNKGNADEKLRTRYYQGIIYENAGDDDLAMKSFLEAMHDEGQVSDTLTLARLLVAQAPLFYKQYRISEFSENNLKAAELFGKLGRRPEQLRCYARALLGLIRLKNKEKATEIAEICRSIIEYDSTLKNQRVIQSLLVYETNLGKEKDIKEMIVATHAMGLTDDARINLARAYVKIGEPHMGWKYINEARISPDDIFDSLTYWAVKTDILGRMGADREALDAFHNYSRLLETYHMKLFTNELLFSEKKHEMEIENMAKLRKRDNTIKWILAGAGCLLLITVVIYYRYRMNKAGLQLAESNAEKLQLESEKQRLLTEKLESDHARLSLEAENLHLQIGHLEEEREQLKELLDTQETLSEEARQVMRERIEMLNGLFAEALTEHESYGKEFRQYIKKIKSDKKEFQESIERVLDATHPEFMKYLRERGLTERELHYACLYAIGLRGKEIGSYLDLARHYNISRDIRQKLGLDTNGKNLGPFLQEMMRK